MILCFFFSSRRRHTRLVSDWSSDVCSSDLRSRAREADIAWMNGVTRVHAIEWDWWDRFRAARICLYLMPAGSFELHSADAGYYVSRETVTPLARVEIDDLVRRHAESRVELRIVDELWPLWDRVVASTLEFSGIRLRNARPPATPSSSYALLPR